MSNNEDNTIVSDKRHLARVLAVQYIFSRLKANEQEGYSAFEVDTLLQLMEETKYDKKLYEKIVDGVEINVKEIDNIIKTTAPDWPLDQVNPVNLAILRCAIWEAFIGKLTPPKVVINEAIEVSKDFSNELDTSNGADGGFINGVLGTVYKKQQKLKKDE